MNIDIKYKSIMTLSLLIMLLGHTNHTYSTQQPEIKQEIFIYNLNKYTLWHIEKHLPKWSDLLNLRSTCKYLRNESISHDRIVQLSGTPDKIKKQILLIESQSKFKNSRFAISISNEHYYTHGKVEQINKQIQSLIEFLANSEKRARKIFSLNIGGNQLLQLSPKIGKLRNLETLNLWWNYLKELPKEIKELYKLKTLMIPYNQIEELPIEIKKLYNLKTLDIRKNKLTDDICKNIKKAMPNTEIIFT